MTADTRPATDTTEAHRPQPDPALRELDFLVGRWTMRGHLIGSDEENITGEVDYEWLPGGFFLRQRIRLDFAGMVEVHAEEFIGYDADAGHFRSLVFSNASPEPLPYSWEVHDGEMKITVSHGPMDSTFHGRLGEDGNSFAGGWRPNPGADESVNVAYDVAGSRAD